VKYVDRVLATVAVLAAAFLIARSVEPLFLPDEGFELPSATTSRITEDAVVLGADDPSLTLVVYSVYTCGYCADLHDRLNTLLNRYPEHLAVAWKSFLSPSADEALTMAHLGLECAGEQGRFTDYNDAMFADPRRASYRDGWRTVGGEAQIPDMDEFERCVRQGDHLGRLTAARAEALAFGFSGTPGTVTSTALSVVGAVELEILDALVANSFNRVAPGADRRDVASSTQGEFTPFDAGGLP